jgi:hypothetical protein
MVDIFNIINEIKTMISEGDRGQILLQTPNKPKSDNKGQSLGKNPDPTNVIGKGEKKAKKLLKGSKKVQESKTEKGKGSKAGREAIHSFDQKSHVNPKKSRVRVYNSITDALRRGYVGQIFSTKGADRLYVITKQKWGTDKEQIVNGRSAKGFTPGSIPSDFKDVKKYAVRTMVRHAGATGKKYKGEAYWKTKRK